MCANYLANSGYGRSARKDSSWNHARRTLYDVHQATASPLAQDALEKIADLFAIEQEIRGHQPDRRLAVRRERTRPLLGGLRAFLDTALTRISGKGLLA